MIQAAKNDLIAFRYASFSHTYSFSDNIPLTTNFFAEIREISEEAVKVGELYATVTDNTVTLFLSRNDLEEIPIGTYRWDLKRVDNDGNEDIIIYGNFIVKEAVTQIP